MESLLTGWLDLRATNWQEFLVESADGKCHFSKIIIDILGITTIFSTISITTISTYSTIVITTIIGPMIATSLITTISQS